MNGEDMNTLTMLRHHLKRTFNFLDVEDVPKLIQRHQRRYELTVLETSAWIKSA